MSTEPKFDKLLMPIIMSIFIPIMVIFSSRNGILDEKKFDELLKSGSIDQKLNFLIERSHDKSDPSNFLIFFAGMIVVMVLIGLLIPGVEKMYPRNVFYIGKEISRIDKISSLKGKLYWVIGAGLLVSIVSGFVVYYTTK